MCSGAMILSRVAEVYFGAYDPERRNSRHFDESFGGRTI